LTTFQKAESGEEEEEEDGTVLKLRTTTSQKCAAIPRRARIQGSWTCVSLNSRLESNKERRRRKMGEKGPESALAGVERPVLRLHGLPTPNIMRLMT